MATGTVAGPMTISITGFGELEVEGDHTYNLGRQKREAVQNPKGEVLGFKEEPQMAKVGGNIILTDTFNQYLSEFLDATDATVALTLPNGGVFQLVDAFQSGTGDGSTENGTIAYEFQGTGSIQI